MQNEKQPFLLSQLFSLCPCKINPWKADLFLGGKNRGVLGGIREVKECLWYFSLVPNSAMRVESCFLKRKAAMNICFWCFFLPTSGSVGIPWRSSYCLLVFNRDFFHGSSPETLQGKNVLEDPRKNIQFSTTR